MDPLQAQIQALEARVGKIESDGVPFFHTHTGFDMNKVFFTDIFNKHVYVQHTIEGADAATAGYYNVFFIAPTAMLVSAFYEVHTVKGTDAGSVTLQLEQLTGTTAPGSGNAILATALSLKATINTVQTATLTGTNAYLKLAAKDRLALKLTGTPTSLSNVSVLVDLTF